MTSTEDRLRSALSATSAGIDPDDTRSLDRIRTRTIAARRRRNSFAALGAAAAVIVVAIGIVPLVLKDDKTGLDVVPADSTTIPEPTTGGTTPSTSVPTTTPGTDALPEAAWMMARSSGELYISARAARNTGPKIERPSAASRAAGGTRIAVCGPRRTPGEAWE